MNSYIVSIFLSIFVLMGMGAKPPLLGGSAPHFILNDLNSHLISLNDYRGKVVVLTFWATWCVPCKKEMPEIQKVYNQYKDRGLAVLGVNFGENQKVVTTFVNKMDISFPVILDRQAKTASSYGVTSLPVTFLIDTDGIIQRQILGGITADSIRDIIINLL